MSQGLLETYESAAKIMAQMLIAARDSAWEKVTELEQSYLLKLEVIKALEQNLRLQEAKLDADDKLRKQVLVQQILADDAEIRTLLFPMMHRITDMIFDAQLHARMPPDSM